MSATDTRAKDCRHLIGGAVGRLRRGPQVRRSRPLHGRRGRERRGGRARRRPPGDRGRARGVRHLVAGRPRPAPGRLPEGRRRARVAPRRGGRVAGEGDRVQLRLRHVPDGLRAGPLPPGRGGGVCAARPGDPLRHARRVCDGRAPARRRRRGDLAVERGPDPLGPRDRRAARVRQHGRPLPIRGVAVRRRPAVGRDLRRGGPARRRAEHRHPRPRRRSRDRGRARRATRGCGGSTSPARPPPAASWPRPPAATSSASCSSSAARTR